MRASRQRSVAVSAGVRVLRSSPHTTVAAAADAVGVPAESLESGLAGLRMLGRCAELAAAAAQTMTPQEDHVNRVAVLSHRVCPPPAARASCDKTRAASSMSGYKMADVAGVAGWGERSDPRSCDATGAVVRAAGRSADWSDRGLAARSSTLGTSQREALATDSHWDVRSSMARTMRRGPRRLYEVFAADENTQQSLAGNRHCPSDLLDRLARYDDNALRRELASNPACSADLLVDLVGDEDWNIDYCVAGNPSCPPALLEELTDHESDEVRDVATASYDAYLASVKR